MAEYIKKYDALSEIFRNSPPDERGVLMNRLNELDTIDIVCCEDCLHSDLDGYYCRGCGMMPAHTTLPQEWCNKGEKRDG